MRILFLVGFLFINLQALGMDQPPTFPPSDPAPKTPPTFPDVDTAMQKYKQLEKKLEACEADKALFNAAYCPANTAPVFCHANGTTLSYVGDFKCNVSIVSSCFGNRIGKVFCGDCKPPAVAQPPVYQPPVYQTPVYTYPGAHGGVVYPSSRPIYRAPVRCGFFGRRCR